MAIERETEQKKKIAFLGGDMRTLAAAKALAGGAYDIFAWGTPPFDGEENIIYAESMHEATEGAFAVVLPLPSTADGTTLNCASMPPEHKITLSAIAETLDKGTVVAGGKLPDTFCDHAALSGIKVFDYFKSEALQIKNAYTTAEAAVNIAMNKLQKNIKDTSFAVTGYGRIAKQLVTLLLAFGADVTVAARKESDLALAALAGAKCVSIANGKKGIEKICNGYDVIFNTVPTWLFDKDVLPILSKDTLLIDLASAPGGVDIAEAKRQRKNVLWATSLPGKYAPESAGIHIAQVVKEIIQGEVAK